MSRDFPFFRQLDAMDCGPTCLRMIAAFHGRRHSLEEIRRRTHITKTGVSVLDLAEAAETFGFRTLPATIELETLREEAPLPAIIPWQQRHFIVVVDAKPGRFTIADPALGVTTIPEDVFRQGWIGRSGVTADGEQPKGIALLLEPGNRSEADVAETPGEPATVHKWPFVWGYLRRHSALATQIVLAILATTLMQLLLPFLTQAMVDRGVSLGKINVIRAILIGQLALFAGRIIGEAIRSRALVHVATRVSAAMAADFLKKLSSLPVSFFESRLSGDVNVRLSDHREIERYLTQSVIPAVGAAVTFVISGVVLATYHTGIFLLFAATAAISTLWVAWLGKRQVALRYEAIENTVRLHGTVYELVAGIFDMKLYNATSFVRRKWEETRGRLFRISLRQLSVTQAQNLGVDFLTESRNLITLYIAAVAVVEGRLSLGMMLAIQYVSGQLAGPIAALQSFVRDSIESGVSIERSAEVHGFADEQGTAAFDVPAGEPEDVEVRDLSFRYGGVHSPVVLDGINLRLPAGSVTAIVGASGSGKTTLVKLLLKYFDPSGGQILVGAQPLPGVSNRSWRAACAAVLQDGYLFSETIATNIALGDDRPDYARLRAAAHAANILETIEQHPLGFERKVGSDGDGMSQGQRQRLLIARAVYKRTPYLFLDEATNSLDAENEADIVRHLRDHFAGRTVLIVAHRLSTVRDADQIIVLRSGRVVERGTHSGLTEARGAYYNLVRNQLELGD